MLQALRADGHALKPNACSFRICDGWHRPHASAVESPNVVAKIPASRVGLAAMVSMHVELAHRFRLHSASRWVSQWHLVQPNASLSTASAQMVKMTIIPPCRAVTSPLRARTQGETTTRGDDLASYHKQQKHNTCLRAQLRGPCAHGPTKYGRLVRGTRSMSVRSNGSLPSRMSSRKQKL